MTARKPEQPSHAVIVERLDSLAEMMRLQFEAGGRRFDRIEARLERIEQREEAAAEARAITATKLVALEAAMPSSPTDWWGFVKRYAPQVLLVVLSLCAGAGLSIISITQLDLFGPLLDAAGRMHEMSKGN